jgi:hypothetical protein
VLVKKAVGHATLEMTMKYYEYLPEHLMVLVHEPAEPAKAVQEAK